MYFEEYGKGNKKTIVMLHGANFVHCFGKQYILADRYHILVPHLMGFGSETDKVFNADEQTKALAEFVSKLDDKPMLAGFSLGAQAGFKLLAEHGGLFSAAVLVSPWLCKEKDMLDRVMKANEKQYAMFKKRWLCSLVGTMNGLSGEQRKEFVEQMQKVSLETIRNSVDNGITLESCPGFENVNIPVIALAGGKEQQEVRDSVIKMSRMNKNCSYEIWEKAAHNIPPMFAARFNELLCRMAEI